ncbi:30S ribosomal protein S8 [Gammaproteobacteria bacterium]|nr:30S ribosomal protein S8 [Gammaproteobacteria bacterium]
MSLSDPIADMLTRIRNGLQVHMTEVVMPSSKVKKAVCEVLQHEGYITGFSENANDNKPVLTVALKYHQGQPVIREIKRVSRPGRRRYVKSDDVPSVLGGYGIAVVSTSKGMMTGQQARKDGVGGEFVCSVY